MTNKLFALLLSTLLMSFTLTCGAADVNELNMKFMNDEKKFEEVMGEFVSLAMRGEVGAMEKMLTPTVRANSNPSILNSYYKNEIVPFFKKHQKIHNVSDLGRAFDNNGHYGWSYYTYSVSVDGENRPFVIQMLEENGVVGVGIIVVNKCIPGWHSLC